MKPTVKLTLMYWVVGAMTSVKTQSELLASMNWVHLYTVLCI